jgi:hypothetical protein
MAVARGSGHWIVHQYRFRETGLGSGQLCGATGFTKSGGGLVYQRASGNYSQIVDVGSSTAATVPNLAGGNTYYLVVGAYNAAGVEGPYSNEVSYTAP